MVDFFSINQVWTIRHIQWAYNSQREALLEKYTNQTGRFDFFYCDSKVQYAIAIGQRRKVTVKTSSKTKTSEDAKTHDAI